MPIDLHAHYLPLELVQRLRERRFAPCIATDPDGSEQLCMPIGALGYGPAYSDMQSRIQYMDKLGVARQVLSLPGLFGIDSLPLAESAALVRIFNDDLIALCNRHPDRFSGLAALPIADMDAAVTELRRTHAAGLL